MTTHDDLAEDERIIAGATAGPWHSVWQQDCLWWAVEDAGDKHIASTASMREENEANAAFIARSRTRWPALVAEVRELRADLQIMVTSFQHAKTYGVDPHFCPVCGTAQATYLRMRFHNVIAKWLARHEEGA